MRELIVFNNISLDGYFVDSAGDVSWAHCASDDPEFRQFVAGNAKGDGELLFGRRTYDMMAGFWPSALALESNPNVAKFMNESPKVVFSRTMVEAAWSNTKLIKTDVAAAVREMKQGDGTKMVVMGSGSIVSQLARENLVDEYQFVINPVALGGGRTLFEGLPEQLNLRLLESRAFPNCKIFVRYGPSTLQVEK